MAMPAGAPPVRWGFLGAGSIARTALGPAVHAAAGAVLQAAAARDVARAQRLGPVGAAYGSYADLVADPAVDAVYIALANDAHLPWVLAALRAGKAVLCEKPLGLSAAEVDEMAAAGGLLVEASWYRWHPRIVLAQQLIADGRIGPVRHVSAGFTFAGVPAGNYRLAAALGGGALYDVGCYPVSAVLWAVGRGTPDDVRARADVGPTGVDLTTEAVLDWSAGASAQVSCSMAADRGQWLVITGERGEIELPGSPYTAGALLRTELLLSDGATTERIAVPPAEPYRLMVQAVSARLRGGDDWVLPLAESRACAATLDACFAAL